MARPKNQGARRLELVQAAKQAIAVRGLTGLRATDVAAQTRLSPGTVAYYYPDLEELIREVHRDAVSRFYWNRMRRVASIDDPRAKLRRTIRSGIPASRDDLDFQALNELHVHAFRNEYHGRLMAELYEREVSLYASVLDEGERRGCFSPLLPVGTIARSLVALEDAYGLHLLGGTPVSRDDVYRLIVANAEAMTRCPLGADEALGESEAPEEFDDSVLRAGEAEWWPNT